MIYITIPRCGSNSIIRSSYDHKHITGFRPTFKPGKPLKEWGSYALWEKLNKPGFTFTFVRNPWDRCVSSWFLMRSPGKTRKWHFDVSFKEFITNEDIAFHPPVAYHTWLSQRHHLLDKNGHIGIDYYGKMENGVQKQIDSLTKRFKLPRLVIKTHNKSVGKKHYSSYYTDELIEIVADRCKEDIEAFGYTFK